MPKTLKILHTSDWHLGKKLFKVSRLEEQKLFLDWLCQKIITEQISHLIIAGDIFDTPHPPSDALKAYFNFLKDVTEQAQCTVFVLAGNHDSGKFLEAPSPFLEQKQIIISGHLSHPLDEEEKTLQAWRKQHLYELKVGNKIYAHLALMPFFRVTDILSLPWCKNQEGPPEEVLLFGIKKWIDLLLCRQPNDSLPLLMSLHHLVGSFMPAGSEQGLNLSGLDSLPLHLFKNQVDYLALGHIHKPQLIKKENPIAYYPGSPIPMRFSEQNHKTCSLIEIDDSGNLQWEPIPIPCTRPLLKLELSEKDWPTKLKQALKNWNEKGLLREGGPSALVEIILNLETPGPHLIEKIKEELKNYPIELISYKSLYKNSTEQEYHSKKQIFEYQPQKLFELMLKERPPQSKDIPAIKTSFQEIEESIYQNGDEF